MKKGLKLLVIFSFILSFVFAACSSTPEANQPPALPPEGTNPPQELPSETPLTIPSPFTETPAPEVTPTNDALPPAPQPISFKAEDGQDLEGLYYPAAAMSSPVVVLMHWAGGSQSDWIEIAYWLQNRGLGGNTSNPSNYPWLDPAWFPKMPEGQSYAVFTFTYRGCTDNGCTTYNRGGWAKDSQAAMSTAAGLEGVDSKRIVSAGASIGADGASDGCFWFNEQVLGSCLGALSFSPGDYLGISYAQAVKSMQEDNPPRPAWCLYGEEDAEAANGCKSGSGPEYQVFSYPGKLHGMTLIQPALDPNPLQTFLDFLDKTIAQ